MVVDTDTLECQTYAVGAACLVQDLLRRLDVVDTIDRALSSQPDLPVTYGTLAQMLIVNRMSFDPQPLYQLGPWVAQHGLDRLFGIDAAWLDDDRLGGMLELLADRQVTVWSQLVQTAQTRFPLSLEWLHADTTSIYFEGSYRHVGSPSASEEAPVPRLLRGYNKDGHPENLQMVISLVTTGRVPLWYRPWDGNQSDDAVYLADLTAMRKQLLAPENAVLIGDSKLASQATMLAFCRQQQQFLSAHCWTPTLRSLWLQTKAKIAVGELAWQSVAYTSRNDARKPKEEAPQFQVVEVTRDLMDEATGRAYPLRFVFVHSSHKAEQDAARREMALSAGDASLSQIAGRLGKYSYKSRAVIESRLQASLKKAKAHGYYRYTLSGTEGSAEWELHWERDEEAIQQAAQCDGVTVLVTNVSPERLGAEGAMRKYREQGCVEQTIDFLKSPVQIRPMWLHKPKRLAGLTLLIMVAVLLAGLLETQVRDWIRKTGCLVTGLKPEGRDNAYPTAKALLRTFADYTLVVMRQAGGQETVHYPKLRPVQQQIWDILKLPPMPGQLVPAGSGK